VPKSGIIFRVDENIDFSLNNESEIKKWIIKILKKENKQAGNISFLFCTDKYLLEINRQFLKHDYYTDIITFDYTEKETIEGEIFISIDRVRENALIYKQPLQQELLRTIIHGILHLCGFKDKTPADKKRMRLKENEALNLHAC
jgi:probable rRNA maturation factor